MICARGMAACCGGDAGVIPCKIRPGGAGCGCGAAIGGEAGVGGMASIVISAKLSPGRNATVLL